MALSAVTVESWDEPTKCIVKREMLWAWTCSSAFLDVWVDVGLGCRNRMHLIALWRLPVCCPFRRLLELCAWCISTHHHLCCCIVEGSVKAFNFCTFVSSPNVWALPALALWVGEWRWRHRQHLACHACHMHSHTCAQCTCHRRIGKLTLD